VYFKAAAVSYSNIPGVNFPPTLVIDIHGASAQQLAEQLTHGGFTADSADTCPEALAAMAAQHYWSMILLGDTWGTASMRRSSLPFRWRIWYPD
jgi:tagatose-1,6-bisphosphate aldolase non-catalytic subunit AgaZ/GatZ